MAITPLPTPPSRDDAANFSDRADAFLGALPTFGTELNATAEDVDTARDEAMAAAATATQAPATISTSTTSLATSAGSKTLTVQTGKTFTPSMWVAITRTADGATWMSGPVTSYNTATGELVVDVQRVGGTGTYAAWTVVGTSPDRADSAPRTLADGSTIIGEDAIARAVGARDLILQTARTTASTLVLTDRGTVIPTNSNVTIPLNATVAFGIGTLIAVMNNKAGSISLQAASGVTLRLEASTSSGTRTVALRSFAYLKKVATDEWWVSGPGVS